jgi:TusA-related sulfurtransferase
MNKSRKMHYISDIDEVFTHKYTDCVDNTISIYINFDNINNLLKLLPKLYNNIPSLRTKIITNVQSYDFSKNIGNTLLKRIVEKYNTANKNKVTKLFIITDDEKIKQNLPEFITCSNNIELKKIVDDDENHILFVDTDYIKMKQIGNNKNVNIMLFNMI